MTGYPWPAAVPLLAADLNAAIDAATNVTQAGAGAIVRSQADKLRDICDLRDFQVAPGSDARAKVQNAIDQAATAKAVLRSHGAALTLGGALVLPNTPFTWEGGGTVMTLADGANSDLFQTAGAYALFGSGSYGGSTGLTLRDITIDGNRLNQTGDPDLRNGLVYYGAKPLLENVTIRNIRGHGIRSEWGQYGEPSGGLEGNGTRIIIDTVGRHGWWNKGPHDIDTTGTIMIDCSQEADGTWCGYYAEGYGNGRHRNMHGWHRAATTNRVKFQISSGGFHTFTAPIMEGGRGQYEGRGPDRLIAPQMFAHYGPANSTMAIICTDTAMIAPNFTNTAADIYAVQIGKAGTGAFGYQIVEGQFFGFREKTPLNFANDLGGGKITGRGFCASGGGTAFGGTRNASTMVDYTQDGTVILARHGILRPLGPYANDAAAAAAGVQVGDPYRKSDGTVAWRVS